jgi:acyl-[acyl-carrier-protein]-phospholipid O-acyltransferase/long-chain-fatty-acid--[acyl-carrier-protein] ligase
MALTKGQNKALADTIGERWIDSTKNPAIKKDYLIIDTLGTKLSSIRALTGSVMLAGKIKKISPEQTVATLLPTSAGAMLCNMAILLLGKTLVNLNYTASAESIQSSIKQADIKTIYTSSRFLQRLEARGIDTSWLDSAANIVILEKVRESISFPQQLLTLLRCRFFSSQTLKKRFLIRVGTETPAVILFSSGSEADPKGIILSHRNLLTNIDQFKVLLKAAQNDVMLANLPLFHALGLTVTEFMPLLENVTVVCHADPTDALATASAIKKYGVSIMFGTSTFYRLYIRNPKITPDQLESLRLVIAGAEKLQTEVREEFYTKFGKVIYEGYGATETAPVASVNVPDETDDDGNIVINHKPGSVGLPIPDTEILIVDPETMSPLPTGESGMILIHGGQVMQGYLNNPEKTKTALPVINDKTWYVTGDKGYLDEDGFLFIQDRYSRFAKIGGEMIALGQVEAAIRKVVNDIELEVVAMNIPDPKKGETVIVLANRSLDKKELKDPLLEKGLTTLALPSAYYLVDEIPKLGSGKTDFGTAKKLAQRVSEIGDKYNKK